MTRFARAKGSKASNEKLPEQASSWSEMKQELLNKNKELAEKKDREEALKRRQDNYQAFLQEKQDEEDKKIAWADFPESQNGKNMVASAKKRKASLSNGHEGEKPKKRDLSHIKTEEDSEDSDGQFSALKSQIDQVLAKQNGNDSDSDDAPPEEVSVKEKPQEVVIKKVKKPKHKLQIVVKKEKELAPQLEAVKTEGETTNVKEEKTLTDKEKKLIQKAKDRSKKQKAKKLKKLVEEEGLNVEQGSTGDKEKNGEVDEVKLAKKLARRKKQKEKKKANQALNKQEEVTKKEDLTEGDLMKIQKKKEKQERQAEKRRKNRAEKALAAEQNKNNNNHFAHNDTDNTNQKFGDRQRFNNENQFPERKPFQKPLNNHQNKMAKPRDDKEHPRRKNKPEKMIINGKTVDVDYIDGFPVKKEDADRLKKLRKEMISKGLPRSEINASLKLERRRAEKAFAREKKNVCFNCRKSGHNLSECPDLDKDQVAQSSGTGICFKCGSTEHTHFECKVVKGLDYKFATCFICKEQGHISRQCPDNQRGLYPKGGSCKVCGDVTHLKKDCPKYQAQQAQLQTSLNIGTMDNGNPDDLMVKGQNNSFPANVGKRLNKVVKF